MQRQWGKEGLSVDGKNTMHLKIFCCRGKDIETTNVLWMWMGMLWQVKKATGS